MNQRRIWFSGLVTAAVGVGIGLVAAKIVQSPFTSSPYRHLERTYMVVFGSGGLLIGASQEALRQLKQKRDQEE